MRTRRRLWVCTAWLSLLCGCSNGASTDGGSRDVARPDGVNGTDVRDALSPFDVSDAADALDPLDTTDSVDAPESFDARPGLDAIDARNEISVTDVPLDTGRESAVGPDATTRDVSSDVRSDAPRDALPDVLPDSGRCTLAPSGAVTVSRDGQVVENLLITAATGSALTINGHANVIVRNCEIRHCAGQGITFSNATNVDIHDVIVIDTCAPASGTLPDANRANISGFGSTGVTITRARVTRGSSGIYLNMCPAARLSFIEGHDVRGPFPRGQLVQFNRCDGSLLEDFSAENPPSTSWPEDIVSVYYSNFVTVRRGVVDGNNSRTGDGIMFEHSDDGLCEDVDSVNQANGCFAAYPGNRDVFRNTRCKDIVCTDQGRGAPSSGGLAWAGEPTSTLLRIETSSYQNLCGGRVWDRTTFSVVDLTAATFTPRPPQRLAFCWGG